ncbi:MAG: lipoyl(octanoyl) transferase LipB [Deltaproteobacteria bacterium]|nr:lipoyl(octanoyl) transferase LipB [Deltaproteobacteria bacterium]
MLKSSSSPSSLTQHQALRAVSVGMNMPYETGMERMRDEVKALQDNPDETVGTLLLLEHRDTITLTRSSGDTHLRKSREAIQEDGIDVVETDRGGDVTYHGIDQLVGYPVVRLGPGSGLRVDLIGYVRALEEALLNACKKLGVKGVHRKEGMTGVWVASDVNAAPASFDRDEKAAKLVAIGVGVGKGVTRHGFALNVATDLERFTDRIVPCGLAGRPVTSLERLLDVTPSFSDVARICAECVAEQLSLPLTEVNLDLLFRDMSPSLSLHSSLTRSNDLSLPTFTSKSPKGADGVLHG